MRLAALGIVFEVNIVMLERVPQALDEQRLSSSILTQTDSTIPIVILDETQNENSVERDFVRGG